MKKFALIAILTLALMPSAEASTRLVTAPKCEEPVPTRNYDGQTMTYGVSIDLSGCWWWDGSPIQLVADLSRLDGAGEEGSTTGTICGGWPKRATDGDGKGDSGDEEQAGGDGDKNAGQAPDDETDSGDKRNGAARHDEEEAAGGESAGDESPDDAEGWSHVASASEGASEARTRRSSCEVATGLEHPPVEVARYRGEVTFPWKDGPKTVGFSAYCVSPGDRCHEDR